MHASLLSSNTTSVEVYEKKKGLRWKYDLGRKKNFEQVFGTKKALWLLPFYSKDDMEKIPALHDLEYPTRSDDES
jgi:palmitoyltransferase